jgi:hypothetical protein
VTKFHNHVLLGTITHQLIIAEYPEHPFMESLTIDGVELGQFVCQEFINKLSDDPNLNAHAQEIEWISRILKRFITHPQTQLIMFNCLKTTNQVIDMNTFERTRVLYSPLLTFGAILLTLLSKSPSRDQLVDDFFKEYERSIPEYTETTQAPSS